MNKPTHDEAQWFEGAGLGIFLHWGAYSVAGIEASWPLRPNSSQHVSVDEYEKFPERFDPVNYDARQWAKAFRQAGATYAVLTTKHHDGYCLFETSTTDYAAPTTRPGRDLVRPYVEACQAEGLKVGLYFSLIDWHDADFATIPIRQHIASPQPFSHDPARWDRFLVRMYAQVRELLTNYGRIDLIWFDVPGFGAARWHSSELKAMMLSLQPHLVVNNRLPEAGDYLTPEQYIPTVGPEGWWESCITMNDQWAYHPDASKYKPTRRLIRTLAQVTGGGGNLLLNIGPQPDGQLPAPAIERLDAIGQWMGHSGESVRQVRRGPGNSAFYGPVTQGANANTVYLHVFDPPLDGVELRGVDQAAVKARLLTTGEELTFMSHRAGHAKPPRHRIHVEVPPEKCDGADTVVAVTFERPVNWIA